MDLITAFKNAMQSAGICNNSEIVADGEIHRFYVEGDKPNSKNGWYVLFSDLIPSGTYGCWKRGINKNWCGRSKESMTSEQQLAHKNRIALAKSKQEKAFAQIRELATLKANSIWNAAPEAKDNHAYLSKKSLSAHGLRVDKQDRLLIPLYNSNNKLVNLQFISPTGEKRFLRGAAVAGNYFFIRGENKFDKIFIAEGYATAMTIHKASGYTAVCAFNNGNLMSVAKEIKSIYPNADIFLAADNDAYGENNIGLIRSKEIASVLGIKYIYPDFSSIDCSNEPTDFNDLMLLTNLDEVKRQVLRNEILSNDKTASPLSITETDIQRLAALSKLEYEQQRTHEAKKMSVRVTELDKFVAARRPQRDECSLGSSGIIFPEIEPWPDSVDAAILLSELVSVVKKYVILGEHDAIAVALWIVFTYCIDSASVSPILNLSSPEKRCGKSTLLSLIGTLVNRPLPASNISVAAVFRTIEECKPTLLLDEADTFFNDDKSELRGIINSGHSREFAFVIRTGGEDHELQRFSTWCPKCLAGIGTLPDTIKDRSIIIRLRRKHKGEVIEKFRQANKNGLINLQRKCSRFSIDNLALIKNYKVIVPAELNDRAADSWETLLIIADLAGNNWPDIARKAALNISAAEEEPVTLSVELLIDIKNIFDNKNVNRISTADLLTDLCRDDESAWATYNRGKPLTAKQLSTRLKPFKIISKTIRLRDGVTLKGYYRGSFIDAFTRYIPCSTVTPSQVSDHAGYRESFSVTLNANVTGKNDLKSSIDAGCDVVTAKNDEAGLMNSIVNL